MDSLVSLLKEQAREVQEPPRRTSESKIRMNDTIEVKPYAVRAAAAANGAAPALVVAATLGANEVEAENGCISRLSRGDVGNNGGPAPHRRGTVAQAEAATDTHLVAGDAPEDGALVREPQLEKAQRLQVALRAFFRLLVFFSAFSLFLAL